MTIIAFELLGNFELGLTAPLKSTIESLLKMQGGEEVAQLLAKGYYRYTNLQSNLKNEIYHILDNNYRAHLDQQTMSAIDEDFQ